MTRQPRWSDAELTTLRSIYPESGAVAAMASLPGRSRHSIHVKAHRLGLETSFTNDAPICLLSGSQLEEAMRLRAEGWGCEKIGKLFGMTECAASNAVLMEEGRREGFKHLERDRNGNLIPESIEKLRLALRKGWKGNVIVKRLGVSAACVAEQRRRYQRDLKARGMAPLPPPGKGEAYSGARVPKAKRAEVERLYLDGYGARKIHQRTGVSHTTCIRIREKLVKRLKRRGETLRGHDEQGVRRQFKDSAHHIPETIKTEFRRLLAERVPVRRAAALAGMGTKSAYELRDEYARELAESGQQLPRPILPGRVKGGHAARTAQWLPRKHLWRFRELARDMSFAEAKATMLAQLENERVEAKARQDAERARPLTFEEQLAKVRAGTGLVAAVKVSKPAPDMTLGGVATGAL